MRSNRAGRRAAVTAVLALLLALVLGLAGCVKVPTSGPIDKVEGPEPGCQNCVNVEVAPPAAGDDPRQVVEGYLRATSNYQPNYSVARQFLTRAAAETWNPDGGATVYRGTTAGSGDTVTLTGTLVGSLEKDRTYTARDQDLKLPFRVTKENGEWRIANPPAGLMVAEVSFQAFYQAYELYFIGNGRSLVPDPIYLPTFRNPDSVASALINALLGGPSKWLKPAVTTAIPPGTALSVDSVVIENGVANVPLSDHVLSLSDADRTLMAAQVVYTLKQQVGGVKGVLFTVNQQPFRVPGSDPTTLVISVNATPTELDPVPFIAGDQLYAVQDRSVEVVTTTGDQSTLTPVAGPLGQAAYPVDALAVSVANTDLAVVTDNRTVLRRGPTANADAEVRTLITGVSDLLRPQFTRYDEVWAMGRRGDRQRVWVWESGQEKAVEVDTGSVLDGGRVLAFKISPDGARMALIRMIDDVPVLGLARITRPDSDRISLDGWRPLDTSQTNKTPVKRMADVGWLDPTNLVVLGAATDDAPLGPVEISQDASVITAENQANQWNAVEIAVLLRTTTALVVGADGKTYRNDGNQWQSFLTGISTIAYPG